MSDFPFKLPTNKGNSGLNLPLTVSAGTSGTHYSIFGIGGYVEVFYLSDLSFSADSIPITYYATTGGSITSIVLNNDNLSSGRRKLGMLAYVYETDTTYQFYIPDYYNSFTATTGTSIYQLRYFDFGQYQNIISTGIAASNSFISSWTNDGIEGVNGCLRANAAWRIFTTSGTSSGGTVTGPYVHLSGDTMTGQLVAPSLSSTTVYLGIDSSGNTRTINANSIVLDSDILNGGSY